MANVKNATIREKVLDRCLHNRRGFSTAEIMDKCNDVLSLHGESIVTAANTIRNDMLAIENRWHVVIESVRIGRNIRYRYADPHFSIYNTPLTSNEINQLNQAISLLHRFDGMPGFEWVDEFNAHIQMTLNRRMDAVVGFDDNKQLKGMQHFTPLFNYISNKQTVAIQYKPYSHLKLDECIVHPYYLKLYNQRWFLIGLNDKLESLSIYALDRIQSVFAIKCPYKPNERIDFSSFFSDIVGVSHPVGIERQEILLSIDSNQMPYLQTKPLHHSQKLIKTNDDGSGIISISVIPNYELIQSILSFGDHVFVVSPLHLKEEIHKRIKKSLNNYQLVHLD